MSPSSSSTARTIGLITLLSLLTWGCGPPEMIPVVLPGSKRPVIIPDHEQAQALGEQMARGAVQPTTEQVADLTIAIAEPTALGESRNTADGLKYETIREGTGPQAKPGSEVAVHYDGTLTNGAQFDSSRGRGQPYTFRIGVNDMRSPIRGWHLGISGMKVGEIRRLTVPADLAYGDRGRPGIPPKSTLVFEVELVAATD